mmetsp:Transcript_101524/g.293827  ORF Transcript_101524/g.293827 Transcript_101524/m.293827 type:complete len:207 (+) Transcript_101524:1240-1860(+)
MPQDCARHEHRRDLDHHPRYSLRRRLRLHEAEDLPPADGRRGAQACGDLAGIGEAARGPCGTRGSGRGISLVRRERVSAIPCADAGRDLAMRVGLRVLAVEILRHREGDELPSRRQAVARLPREGGALSLPDRRFGQKRRTDRRGSQAGDVARAPNVLVLLARISGLRLHSRDVDHRCNAFRGDASLRRAIPKAEGAGAEDSACAA